MIIIINMKKIPVYKLYWSNMSKDIIFEKTPSGKLVAT